MIKKILTIVSVLIFISCTQLSINSAYKNANRSNYHNAINQLTREAETNSNNIKVVTAYREIFSKGQEYYTNTGNEEELFLMEDLYLRLPQISKQNLGIDIDMARHKKMGKNVAKEYLARANNMPEKLYKEKVQKHFTYEDVLLFDPELRNEVNAELRRLRNKIERTYTYDIRAYDYDLSSYMDRIFLEKIKNIKFKYSRNNADIKLLIDFEIYNYSPEKISNKTVPRQIREENTDSQGNKVLNVINYYENQFTKEAELRMVVSYKLVSTISGEVFFENRKRENKKYEEHWKTYVLVSGNPKNFPKDEAEKQLPNISKIREETINRLFENINNDLKNLNLKYID
ncbi:hypothetical protein [Fusobacterium russii]|uniref:hypothetical protein n=1 Tax=Fusobacterium russii TaxID=854 RepID=UPI0003A30116|nr:hypothetical protein [Fusobacterium russii]